MKEYPTILAALVVGTLFFFPKSHPSCEPGCNCWDSPECISCMGAEGHKCRGFVQVVDADNVCGKDKVCYGIIIPTRGCRCYIDPPPGEWDERFWGPKLGTDESEE